MVETGTLVSETQKPYEGQGEAGPWNETQPVPAGGGGVGGGGEQESCPESFSIQNEKDGLPLCLPGTPAT